MSLVTEIIVQVLYQTYVQLVHYFVLSLVCKTLINKRYVSLILYLKGICYYLMCTPIFDINSFRGMALCGGPPKGALYWGDHNLVNFPISGAPLEAVCMYLINSF